MEEKEQRGGARLRELLRLAAFVGVLIAARASLADHYVVPSGSMEPTVMTGDRLVVHKAAYGARVPFTNTYLVRDEGPRRGDVVVLDVDGEKDVLLKRIAAVPGDTIAVRGGRISIDGAVAPVVRHAGGLFERLGSASHAVLLTHGGGPDFGPVTLGKDQYLVLGDNRGDSRDGRYFGLVDRGAILGRALGVYRRDGAFTWVAL